MYYVLFLEIKHISYSWLTFVRTVNRALFRSYVLRSFPDIVYYVIISVSAMVLLWLLVLQRG